jgi:hypothetical protein
MDTYIDCKGVITEANLRIHSKTQHSIYATLKKEATGLEDASVISDCPSDMENIDPLRVFSGKSRCPSLSSIESKDLDVMVALLESKAKSKQAIRNAASRSNASLGSVSQTSSGKNTLDALTKALLQNKSLDAQIAKLKMDVRELTGQRDAMKSYINGLESALVNLQKRFSDNSNSNAKSPEHSSILNDHERTSTSCNKVIEVGGNESIENASSLHFRTVFMQKAFKSLLCSRDAVSVRRHAEVMCALLQYSNSDRTQIIASAERLSPFLCALGTYDLFF